MEEEAKKEDWELAELIKKEDDGEALEELCSRHSGIFINMVYRYGAPMSQTQRTDLIDERTYHIYKAAKKYEKEKSKFSTFLASQTMYNCLDRNAENRKDSTVNFDDICFQEKSEDILPDECCSEKERLLDVLEQVENLKSDKEKRIFQKRYFETTNFKLTPWSKIAKDLGISVQGCINIHNKVIEEISKNLKKHEIKLRSTHQLA